MSQQEWPLSGYLLIVVVVAALAIVTGHCGSTKGDHAVGWYQKREAPRQ